MSFSSLKRVASLAAVCAMMSTAAAADGLGNRDGFLTDPVVVPPGSNARLGTTDLYSAPLPDERSPARPELVGIDNNGQAYTTGAYHDQVVSNQAGARQVLARAGDYVYATLLYGFNSDDPRGLPAYAMVTDVLENGSFGPLHGARIEGRLSYNRNNASLLFQRIILEDGRDISMQGMAVSPDAARTGIAANVDRHRLQNYGSLFIAGLLEGVGNIATANVAAQAVPDNIIVTGDGTVTIDEQNELTREELLYGALAPVGRNVTQEILRNGTRPPTISAPAGYSFGVIFTDTLVYDPAAVGGTPAFNARTGTFEAGGIRDVVQPVATQGAAQAGSQEQIQALQQQIDALRGANISAGGQAEVGAAPGDLFLQQQQGFGSN